MGSCAHTLFERVACPICILEIDVVGPVILAAGSIVVGIDIVPVRGSKIAEDLLVHDRDLSLDCTLAIIDIGLRGMHDSPASQAIISEG